MTVATVRIQEEIHAELLDVFQWFYHSENYTKSPIVFRSRWISSTKWTPGSKRDIMMIVGRYFEEITDISEECFIRYRVVSSIPSVKQEFTEITFEEIEQGIIRVIWTIEIEVPVPFKKDFLNRIAGKMAGWLYKTILAAGKKELEAQKNEVK